MQPEPSAASVSVVVQGPIVVADKPAVGRCNTSDVLQSVRRWLPEAELVLSTWKGANCTGLEADAVVLSEDPGAISINDDTMGHVFNNLNRMLLSTSAGLRQCSRPYAIKLRTDTPLVSAPPYHAIGSIDPSSGFRLFAGRIVASNVYTRNPLERPVLFHLSDLVHFGFTDDLRLLWSAPLVQEPSFTRWLDGRSKPRCDAYPENDYRFRCAPEQYLVESLIRRNWPEVFLDNPGDGCLRWLFLWLRFLASHFVVIPQQHFFAAMPARMEQHALGFDVWHDEQLAWLELWAGRSIPWAVQLQAIIGYYESRYRYARGFRAKSYVTRLRNILFACVSHGRRYGRLAA